MSPLGNKEPPAWFAADNYKAITQFSRRDWYLALCAREQQTFVYAIAKAGIGESVDTPEDKERFWSNYLDTVLFWQSGSGRAESNFDTPSVLRDYTSIEDVTHTVANIPNSNIFMIHHHVAELEKRLLIVDPRAPDTVLLREFKAWLQHIRKTHPLPTKRRGRGRANVAITGDHLERWRRYVVPACLDLDFYAEVSAAAPLTHETLCNLLALTHQGEPKEWGREARKAAKEAFECVDLLGYQTSGETN